MKASKKFLNLLLVAIALSLFLPVPAFAHHAMGGATPQTWLQGLLSGLAHPVIGIDHLLFLLSAALLAYGLGSPSKYLTPAVFLLGGFFGTGVHLAAFTVPLVAALTALSLMVGGAMVLRRRPMSGAAIAVFFAMAGVVHGYAYAESIVGAEVKVLTAYLLGLAVIQYLVITTAMMALSRLTGPGEPGYVNVARRFAGVSALVGGAVFLALNWIT